MRSTLALVFLACICAATAPADEPKYSWQQPHAKILATGDLQWEPKPFVFVTGNEVRYIDFDNGSDDNDGLTKQTPWQHHPWDKAFKGVPESDAGVDAYIFKRGVVYRGSLAVTRGGIEDQPIRLTSDPSWGQGEAVLAGSELAADWKLGADRDDIPDGEKVWYTDINTKSRAVWMVDAEGKITRIELARTPNWTVSDPDDVMSEWYTWKNDGWWLDGMKNQAHRVRQGGKEYQLGIDPENLKGDLERYRDATVWTEWGIVMGTPYPTRVVDVIPDNNALMYDGVFYNIWGQIAGHRYFLEDRPQFLDTAGEYWLDQKGRGGRLYIRLPGDVDPNTVRIETAARTTMIDAKGMSHIRISGLTFRFGNIPWSYWGYPFGSPDNMGVACIRSLGPTKDVKITNCSFEQVPRAIRMVGSKYAENIDLIDIEDCTFREIDQSAVHIYSDNFPDARVGEVNFRRNHLCRITLRAQKNTHCHAVYVQRLERGEFAGNFLERLYAGGIFIEGCKGSGDSGEAPLTRILIHHNKVVDPLLASCDWGGIEQNQGGPAYIYDNVVGNPGGLHYWKYLNQDPDKPAEGTPRFGHAYYIDGSFKKYVFNNIAWGKNNTLGSKYANCSGLQEIIGFENTAFNNTFYKFVQASRRQAPQAGRNKYLGNIFDDVSQFVFRHSDAKQQDANAQDAGEAAKLFAYETLAYANNVLHDISGKVGTFEADGTVYDTVEEFAAALRKRHALASNFGEEVDMSPLIDPAGHDFRPAPGGPAIDRGVKVFVPWGLYATVGEWHFTRNHEDPTRIIDEHWYMTSYYDQRQTYKDTPRYPLEAINVTEDSYREGPLEDWTRGALVLNGKDQLAFLSGKKLVEPFTMVGESRKSKGGVTTFTRTETTFDPQLLKNVNVGEDNFLVEVFFRTEPGHTGGALVSKIETGNGYQLAIGPGGGIRFTVGSEDRTVVLEAPPKVNDSRWHHVIAEMDRASRIMRIYIDGEQAVEKASVEIVPKDSLSGSDDFLVGKDHAGNYFAGAIDFLRVCRGTLADAHTTIEELYAWQSDGPFLRDFCGRKPIDGRRDAGALEQPASP